MPFSTATKRVKYLGIILPEETKHPYAENYETVMKEIKTTHTDGEIYHVLALEKEMAIYSSVLAWKIPGMGSHRVRHDWSDLAVAVHSPYQITNGTFHRTITKNFSLYGNTKDPE